MVDTPCEVVRTKTFDQWLRQLKNLCAVARVEKRIEQLAAGNLGDARPVGGGISELRIHTGPGYRLYHFRAELRLIVLLCGGDKSTQASDIKEAQRLAKGWVYR